jgi:hypothetical protein
MMKLVLYLKYMTRKLKDMIGHQKLLFSQELQRSEDIELLLLEMDLPHL